MTIKRQAQSRVRDEDDEEHLPGVARARRADGEGARGAYGRRGGEGRAEVGARPEGHLEAAAERERGVQRGEWEEGSAQEASEREQGARGLACFERCGGGGGVGGWGGVRSGGAPPGGGRQLDHGFGGAGCREQHEVDRARVLRIERRANGL
eukprot:4316068-Prymnesium_polylepis.2